MGLIRSISLIGLLLLGAAVSANPITDLANNSQQVNPEGSAPNPFSLLGDWWVYVDLEHENLNERVGFVKKGINQTLDTLNPELKSGLSSDANVVNGLLNNLIKLKSAKSEIHYPDASYKQSYKFKDIKALFEKYHSIRSKREQLTELTVSETSKSKKALDNNAELMVVYRGIKDNTPEKLELGLKIMANRLGWFVWTQRQEVVKNGIKFLDKQQDSILKEIEFASNHLKTSDAYLKTIDKEIDKQGVEIEKLQSEKITARESYAKNLGIDYISRIKLKLYAQQLKNSEIREKLAEIEQSLNYAYKALILLNRDDSSSEEFNAVAVYDNNISLYDEISTQLKVWKQDTSEEQNDLQSLIASNVLVDDQSALDRVNEERTKALQTALEQLSLIETELFDFNYINNVLEKKLGKTKGWNFKFRNTTVFLYDQTFLRAWKLINTSLFELGSIPVTTWDLIQALLILFITYAVAKFLQKTLVKLSTTTEGKIPPPIYTLSRVIFYLIIVLGVFSAFASIGVNFTNLAIVAGALSVGIGFGLQSIVNNFVSGIIILIEQNIKIGDFVELDSGLKGIVSDINVRSTIVNTLDNLDIIVPNSELVAAKVTNYTLNEPIVRIHIPFGVAYGSDKELVKKAVLEAAKNVSITYDDGVNRRPQVWLTGFGDSSLNFELVNWVSPKLGRAAPGSWKALYNWEIESALHKYGIEIPFPQRDIHIKTEHISSADKQELPHQL